MQWINNCSEPERHGELMLLTSDSSPRVTLADGWALAEVSVWRRRMLMVAPLVVGALWYSAFRVQPDQLGITVAGVRLLVSGALVQLAVLLLVGLGLLRYRVGATLTLLILSSLMLARVVGLFVNGRFGLPGESVFLPVFSHYAALYLLMALLLPPPQALRGAALAWLTLGLITTLGSHQYLEHHAEPPMLDALLAYVWLGHGFMVLLLAGWAYQQKGLAERYGRLAASAELARHQSELRFRSVFDQAAAGILLLDERGALLAANARAAALLGYAPDELERFRIAELVAPEHQTELAQRLERLRSGQLDSHALDELFLHRDGSTRWFEVHHRWVHASPELPAHSVLVMIDIDARKRAQQAVIEHERVREFHYRNTPLGVIEWSADLRVKRWSPRAEAIFGWSEAEVLGRRIEDWPGIADTTLASISAMQRAMLAGRDSQASTLLRLTRRDGHAVCCHWYNSLLRDDRGAVQSVHSLINDVSDEQLALTALRESQAQFRSVFEQAAVGIAMLDAQHRWILVNRRFCEITGYGEAELLARSSWDLTHGADRSLEVAHREQLLGRLIDDYNVELRYLRKDGSAVSVSVFARRLDDAAGHAARIALVVEDITLRKQGEQRIQQLNADLERKVAERTQQLRETMRSWAERNQQLSLLAEMMGVLPAARDIAEATRIVARYLPRLFHAYGGAIWLADGADSRFLLIERWGSVGHPPASLVADDCWALRRGQTQLVDDPTDPLICTHLEPMPASSNAHVCTPVIALGESIGVIHLSWSEDIASTVGAPDRALLSSAAEQIGLAIGNVRLREELRRQAARDALTGLFNRRHFDEYLARRLAEVVRTGRRFALLMIDIDHFKAINDRYGHDVGDEVLRQVGRTLQGIVRADEAVFRLGGEEFVMLINDDSGRDMLGCAERVRREIEQAEIRCNDLLLPTVTVSVGAARHPATGIEAAQLVQRADQALYAAKRGGRNQVCFIDSEIAPVADEQSAETVVAA